MGGGGVSIQDGTARKLISNGTPSPATLSERHDFMQSPRFTRSCAVDMK